MLLDIPQQQDRPKYGAQNALFLSIPTPFNDTWTPEVCGHVMSSFFASKALPLPPELEDLSGYRTETS